MPKFNVTVPVLLILVFLSTAVVRSARQTQDEPVRIGINLVTLDVAVTDKRRRPVHNLTARDFTVLEDGAPQSIEAFTAGSAIPARPEQKPRGDQNETARAKSDRQSATQSTNGPTRPFVGYRFISIAVDNTSVEAANRDSVERAMSRYLREQLQPDDLVAIYSITNSVALVQSFTSDRDKLLRAASSVARGQLATDAAATREQASKERAARSIGTGSSPRSSRTRGARCSRATTTSPTTSRRSRYSAASAQS